MGNMKNIPNTKLRWIGFIHVFKNLETKQDINGKVVILCSVRKGVNWSREEGGGVGPTTLWLRTRKWGQVAWAIRVQSRWQTNQKAPLEIDVDPLKPPNPLFGLMKKGPSKWALSKISCKLPDIQFSYVGPYPPPKNRNSSALLHFIFLFASYLLSLLTTCATCVHCIWQTLPNIMNYIKGRKTFKAFLPFFLKMWSRWICPTTPPSPMSVALSPSFFYNGYDELLSLLSTF